MGWVIIPKSQNRDLGHPKICEIASRKTKAGPSTALRMMMLSVVVSHPFNHPNDEDLSLGTPISQRTRMDGHRSFVDGLT
jgi:hypothetical protein